MTSAENHAFSPMQYYLILGRPQFFPTVPKIFHWTSWTYPVIQDHRKYGADFHIDCKTDWLFGRLHYQVFNLVLNIFIVIDNKWYMFNFLLSCKTNPNVLYCTGITSFKLKYSNFFYMIHSDTFCSAFPLNISSLTMF